MDAAAHGANEERVVMGSTMEQELDLLIEQDHRAVERLFAAFTGTGVDRQGIVDRIIEELSRHAAAEEEVVYPEMARKLAGGDQKTAEARDEHAAMKRILAELDQRPAPGDVERLIRALEQEVKHHVQEEEGDLLPSLRRAVGDLRMRELGATFQTAKRMAPTHPHPHAPDAPPGNLVAGPVAAAADRLRDAVDPKR
jgi:iron-sulfur cluster repair protein YtfE (RIC family)